MNLGYIDPVDPYPTNPNGFAYTSWNLLTPEQQQALINGMVNGPSGIPLPTSLIRDPFGVALGPSDGTVGTANSPGGLYPDQQTIFGLPKPLALLLIAALVVYLLTRKDNHG